MPSDGLFSGDIENIFRWAAGAGIVLALAAAGTLVYVLSRPPTWRVTQVARWVLLVGMVLLPSMSLLLGNTVGLHRVESSCVGACHTMDPWVSDLLNPKSKTLASRHHQNRWINENPCSTCHTGYGLGGNLRAKISGLGHVWKYYVAGVPGEIKISRPFPMATCLHCHGGTPGFLKSEAHNDPEQRAAILSGETSCFECHPAPHPRKDE